MHKLNTAALVPVPYYTVLAYAGHKLLRTLAARKENLLAIAPCQSPASVKRLLLILRAISSCLCGSLIVFPLVSLRAPSLSKIPTRF